VSPNRGTLVGVAEEEEPPPPPPDPCVPGITDSFTRPDSALEFGLGVSDSTLEWFNGAKQGPGWSDAPLGPSNLMYNAGGRGKALGWYSTEAPGSLWIDYPRAVIERPVSGGPGPPFGPGFDYWPFPFTGSIVITDADNFPGFSGPDSALGYPWRGFAYNSGGEVKLPAPVVPGPTFSEFSVGGSGSGNAPKQFTPYEPWEYTGRFRLDMFGGSSPIIEDWVLIVFAFSTTTGVRVGKVDGFTGFGAPIEESTLGLDGAGGTLFPDFFWTDLAGAFVDFTITCTGGFGADLTLTVGPASLTATLNADEMVTDFFISNRSRYGTGDPGEPAADMYIEDTLEVNGKRIDSSIMFQWTTFGATGPGDGNKTLRYTFTYYTLGADGGYPHGPPTGYEAGIVAYGDPHGGHPAVVGPLIMVRIDEVSTSTSPGATILSGTVAWLQLDDEIGFPFIPYVTITPAGATLTIDAFNVAALNADAVDFTTGDAAPLGDAIEVQGHLMMDLLNGLGTYIGFDNLDIDGVNNCTVLGLA
jgi:hypothetical protein